MPKTAYEEPNRLGIFIILHTSGLGRRIGDGVVAWQIPRNNSPWNNIRHGSPGFVSTCHSLYESLPLRSLVEYAFYPLKNRSGLSTG